MYRFHIKSIILGIGIGIVITSFIGIINSAGMDSGTNRGEITRPSASPVIIEESKKKGYEENSREKEKALEDTTKNGDINDNNQNKETPVQTDRILTTPLKPINDEITLNIVPGDTSETIADKLYVLGVIDNTELFMNKIIAMKLDGSIQVGEFKIKKGTGMVDIIEKICEY
ncbi:MAG: endolytic transglycosylase MltG [Clostridiaceae bacterium]|nr:endolytic transglycosylase MltG [Clostridiaceae bacterium]